jgi:hypothetical protein
MEIRRFLCGWTLFLVIETGTIAMAIAFAKFLGVFSRQFLG